MSDPRKLAEAVLRWGSSQRRWQSGPPAGHTTLARELLSALDALEAANKERERLIGVLRQIEDNARSWHGPIADDNRHARALGVIAGWVDAALAGGGHEEPEEQDLGGTVSGTVPTSGKSEEA